MKFVAAYLLACLGADAAATTAAAAAAAAEGEEAGAAVLQAPGRPTKDDVRRILGSVGAEVEDDRLDLLFALLEGKGDVDVADLVAAGREQLAYAPSGAATAAAAGAPSAGAAAAEAEEKKEDEAKKAEEEEEEEESGLFNLFD